MTKTGTFAERLRSALRDSGRRAVDVYKEIGVSKATWYHWLGERESVPEPETCLRLARSLGVEARWLIDGTGERQLYQPMLTQEQIDIAEAWPFLSPALREQIAVLIRHAAVELVPSLKKPLATVDKHLQERANRLLERAQEAARAKTK